MLRQLWAGLTIVLMLSGGGELWQEKREEVLLPVLMYHEVRYDDPGKDAILPEEMERDLQYLQREGYTTVLMEDVLAFVYTGKSLPEKPILLTFDDGYESSYRRLFPLLKRYGAKAVISVIGKSADEFSLMPEQGGPYVHASWKELLEMRDSGCIELQNHSYDLHHESGGEQGCRRRWGENDFDYEDRIRRDVDRLEGILEECGFLATLTCDFGINRLTRDPDCLRRMKRICRSHGADLEKLLSQAEATLERSAAP